MKLRKYLIEAPQDNIIEFFNTYFMLSDFTEKDLKKVKIVAKKIGKKMSMDNYTIFLNDGPYSKKFPISSRDIVKETKMSFIKFIQFIKKKGANIEEIPDVFK